MRKTVQNLITTWKNLTHEGINCNFLSYTTRKVKRFFTCREKECFISCPYSSVN